MNKEIINKMADLWSQVTEKNLDPVNKDAVKKKFDDRKDKDIDNDGDTDSTDKYLHKRRKAISKAVTNENKDKMDKCPDCEGSMENHDPDCPRAEKGDKKKIEDDLDAKSAHKALKHDCASHVTSEQWGYGECISGEHTLVEQEDGTAIVTHYDVMFEHGVEKNVPVEDLTIMREKSHIHASKKMKTEATQPDSKEKGKGEKALDKFKGAGSKKMAADNNVDSPKEADITPEEEGHDDASKAGKVTKPASPRSASDKLSNGDKKIVKGGTK